MIAIIIILLSLLYPGIIDKTKARLSGRKGPKLYQFIFDVLRLFKKGSVFSSNSSYIFQLSAIVNLAVSITILLILPFGTLPAIISFNGEFIFVLYLMAFGKFFQVASALDVSSGFEGMGANREVLYHTLTEPAFLMLMGTLCIFTGHANFHDIYHELYYNDHAPSIIVVVVVFAIAMFMIMLVESSRIPTDDPNTHLELTMVHEVMALDHSGFDLGLIKLNGALRFAIYGTLIANVIIPGFLPLYILLPLFLGIHLLMAFGIGFIESFKPRNKIGRNPQYIISISAIAAVLYIVIIIIKSNIV